MRKIILTAIILITTVLTAKTILVCTEEDGCKVIYIKE